MSALSDNFFRCTIETIEKIDKSKIEKLASAINLLRKRKGRLFFFGVGGSAGNCSHAVNDFRKLCNVESYCVTDNVSEITARINDEGWENSYVDWFKSSFPKKNDAVFVMSVGGGSLEKKLSVNLVKLIQYARKNRNKVFSIVGPNGGYAGKNSDVCIKLPVNDKKFITPQVESLQVLIWHFLVTHPKLKKNKTMW